jgi:hypothetical protein
VLVLGAVAAGLQTALRGRERPARSNGGTLVNPRLNAFLMDDRVFAWIAIATGLLVAMPLIATQFVAGMDWGVFDFAALGALVFGAGSLFVLVARLTTRRRALVGLVILAGVIYVWAELAVGVFTGLGS